ncbi:hypothetical protein [Pseudanabaena sp. ABRG5-3]|uniref:hypothetical protein n=1 Tax=Pseudanabaena sp. ABRG5-3 TaxID=685565 RepID=UPI000DC70BD2|nr:hypothetical protein [Pseudanabaena sp. ABRG5-3]BBC24308.1 hypothetical protein ABRG53_2051 [Pseudanabaena sp. ABRG5-3]
MTMNRIALIVYYIGLFPNKYFRYFIDTAARNSDIDFRIGCISVFNEYRQFKSEAQHLEILA